MQEYKWGGLTSGSADSLRSRPHNQRLELSSAPASKLASALVA